MAPPPAPPIEAYPPWNKPSLAPSPVVPYDPLVPCLRPPHAVAPPHPPRPALPPPPAGYTRSVHAAPAAWPRQLRESEGTCSRPSNPFGPDPVPAGEDKQARAARLEKEKDTCLLRRAAATPWGADEASKSPQPALWLAAERWRRDAPVPGGVTLVFAHANGLQKELWHPMARHLLAQQGTPGALFGSGAPLSRAVQPVVNDIWFIDDTVHGASQELNAGRLAPVYAWIDYGRDMLNFVEHVLPAYASSPAEAPWQLGWKDKGADPPVPAVIGVGHSYGGNGLVQASVASPDAFAALFLVEPLNQPKLGPKTPVTFNPIVANALKRRSEWPTLDAAATMRNNPMFKTWDADAFALFLSHGLVPTDPARPDGEVTLATPRWAEAAIFSDPVGPQRGWDKLLELSVPAGLLMAGDTSWMGGPKVANEAATRAPRARNERLAVAGHLLPQEHPAAAGAAIWRFLATLAAGDWDRQPGRL